MLKRYLIVIVVNLFLLSWAVTSFSEELLYVQPFQAKIYAKPAFGSEIIATVESGFQFSSSGKEGNWQKLSYKGKQGFLLAVQVAKTPPLGKSSTQAAETSPKLGARARTSSSAAVVAGMKGLTYEDRARVTSSERSDLDALDKVNALIITSDELKQFQLEGGK